MGLIKGTDVTDRRKSERRKVMWGSRLASMDGSQIINCTTLEISPSGARVRMDEQHTPARTLFYIELRHSLAYEARIAWSKAPEMGLEFLKVHRVSDVPVLAGKIEAEGLLA
jgi:hypothetical protein